jgi:hypothetical protein
MKCKIVIEKPVIKFLQAHREIADRFFEKIEMMEKNLLSSILDIKRMR